MNLCVFKLSPGRRVLVGASKGVAGAFSALHSIMVQNQVKKTLYAHTRHEKKGPKRRRLRQMRWHNLFAHTVKSSALMSVQLSYLPAGPAEGSASQ